MYQCDNDPPENVLSDSAVKEIESLVGAKIRLIVAFDENANAVPLRPASVTQTVIKVSNETPLETRSVTDIKSSAFGSYVGSNCVFWTTDGVTYSFCFDSLS